MSFTIYPAIDLRNGQVVRLELGDPNRKTIFGNDPAKTARQWAQAGASWLHVVNLDGAFDEKGNVNWQVMPDLAAAGLPIQMGGGIRSLKDIAQALNRGAARVILGTMAVEEPDTVAEAVRFFGSQRIAVGIDAQDGYVRTHGWQNNTLLTPENLAMQMMALGVRTIIYTDISRDGVYAGVNIHSAAALAGATGLKVIASGGVAAIEDVQRAIAHENEGISGLIIGRALYEGRVDLATALSLVKESENYVG